MPSPAAPPPVTIATLSLSPQLSGMSKRTSASAMSSSIQNRASAGGDPAPRRPAARTTPEHAPLERILTPPIADSAERHPQDADRVRWEFMLEPVPSCREARLAHVDRPGDLEGIGRIDVGAVDLRRAHRVLDDGLTPP